MDVLMSKKLKILHQIIYNDNDIDRGNMIIMFMVEDAIIEVVATPYICNHNFCDVFGKYKFNGFSSN
jgi:hypothetical protein